MVQKIILLGFLIFPLGLFSQRIQDMKLKNKNDSLVYIYAELMTAETYIWNDLNDVLLILKDSVFHFGKIPQKTSDDYYENHFEKAEKFAGKIPIEGNTSLKNSLDLLRTKLIVIDLYCDSISLLKRNLWHLAYRNQHKECSTGIHQLNDYLQQLLVWIDEMKYLLLDGLKQKEN